MQKLTVNKMKEFGGRPKRFGGQRNENRLDKKPRDRLPPNKQDKSGFLRK